MEGLRGSTSTTTTNPSRLHTVKPMPQTTFNHIFAPIFACAILALFYHHITTLLYSKTLFSFSVTLILFISDLILAFMWINTESLRMRPVHRQQFPENLKKVMKESDYPALDVFICTADPYKEPPISLANTALSVMAYDYPTEKISVYVSDDGGSALTLFALMEAAKFASHWLPFCQKNNLVDRGPEAYFQSNQPCSSSEFDKIKDMYESMKLKIEQVLERGKIDDELLSGHQEREAFNKWTDNFTRQDHPTIIQVVLDNSKNTDVSGQQMPNLIYVSRQKSKTSPHHFKAGALNVLIRVSAVMTNSPIILTLDCDTLSNDPKTPLRVLCYLCDPDLDPECRSRLGYFQFPQRFSGINKNDIYGCMCTRMAVLSPMGFDGLMGPNYIGTGCFFNRRALFGGPSNLISPQIPELDPQHVVDKTLQSQSIFALAHQVATCHFETHNTNWGEKIGFRYGSLAEDNFTSYRMQSEGWKSIFCHPKRAAFLGDSPTTLIEVLNQQKRWTFGLLQVGFSKYCPITFGIRAISPFMALGYGHYFFWGIWSIPITVYNFLPQLTLLNKVYIFPKVSEQFPWFLLYLFLFLGAYGQDFIDFMFVGVSFKAWWSDQRIWHIRGLTCQLFGFIEFLLKTVGISSFGFNVTSKTVDSEVSKRYEQGIFEFGVHSPMFVSLTMAALVNLASLIHGSFQVFRDGNLEEPFMQIVIAGLAALNYWPTYEAIMFRTDSGKMPIKTTIMATFLACCLYLVTSSILKSNGFVLILKDMP
ncbi:cellulose synthase-like protein G3 [Jatropha curcas]|uniref:cellulose synthase-like protein G3 n=1 Tax=Jatropha curcas TaxID=180498 RepID=UPI0005FB72C0|nr:cellulose synthase-like protein G3 [Jatropha curcas]